MDDGSIVTNKRQHGRLRKNRVGAAPDDPLRTRQALKIHPVPPSSPPSSHLPSSYSSSSSSSSSGASLSCSSSSSTTTKRSSSAQSTSSSRSSSHNSEPGRRHGRRQGDRFSDDQPSPRSPRGRPADRRGVRRSDSARSGSPGASPDGGSTKSSERGEAAATPLRSSEGNGDSRSVKGGADKAERRHRRSASNKRRSSGKDLEHRCHRRRRPSERRKQSRRDRDVKRGYRRRSGGHDSDDSRSRRRAPMHASRSLDRGARRRESTERKKREPERRSRDYRHSNAADGQEAHRSRYRAREDEGRTARTPRKHEGKSGRHSSLRFRGGGIQREDIPTAVAAVGDGGGGAGGNDVDDNRTKSTLADPSPFDALTELQEMDRRKEPGYIKNVVLIQCVMRGYIARRRVERRIHARAALREACFGVGMKIIEDYIRQEVAPAVITSVLAEGVEGVFAPVQSAEITVVAQAILDETVLSMVAGAVKLAVQQETNSHLDVVFVRDRKNPLLAVVDDVVADTLRVCTREVVVEVVKGCTEDYMFGRRLFALVEELIEEEVVGSARPIAYGVYYNSTALAMFSGLEQEVCSEEAVSVVAETMAPFEDHLVELQREKDVAAIQSAAQSVIVKGLQLQHAARTLGQRGKLVVMSDINGKTLNLLLAGRFLAILRAAETNRLQICTSPLLSLLFRRLVVRTGRSVLLDLLSRELDRDETALHELELERIDEVDRQRRRAARTRAEETPSSYPAAKPPKVKSSY